MFLIIIFETTASGDHQHMFRNGFKIMNCDIATINMFPLVSFPTYRYVLRTQDTSYSDHLSGRGSLEVFPDDRHLMIV